MALSVKDLLFYFLLIVDFLQAVALLKVAVGNGVAIQKSLAILLLTVFRGPENFELEVCTAFQKHALQGLEFLKKLVGLQPAIEELQSVVIEAHKVLLEIDKLVCPALELVQPV